MCTCDFSWGPSFRGPVRGAHNFPYISLCKSIYALQILFLTNRIHWSDLKGCVKMCSRFLCHVEVNILTRFGIFCLFRYLYTYTPLKRYNKFDWLILSFRSNSSCRMCFGMLSLRAFCILAQILPILYHYPVIAL